MASVVDQILCSLYTLLLLFQQNSDEPEKLLKWVIPDFPTVHV